MTEEELVGLREFVNSCYLAQKLIENRKEFIQCLEMGNMVEVKILREGTTSLFAMLTDPQRKFLREWLLNNQRIDLEKVEREFRERKIK